MKIAILITCHNRKNKTLACLEALFHCFKQVNSVQYKVYLVDDGSTDGTSTAVLKAFSDINIIKGDGSLYWNGGMNLAWREALKSRYDAYLWLNDDTLLYPKSINLLLKEYNEQKHSTCIIVGSTQDERTGTFTYGGVRRNSKFHPLKFEGVQPSTVTKECDTINGNCVFIPSEVVKMVGVLSDYYQHSGGDFDYGLRAKRKGVKLLVSSGYVGTCSKNDTKDTWLDKNLSITDRIKKRHHIKALPMKTWYFFCRSHAGVFWPVFFISPYVKMVLESAFKVERA